MNSRVYITGFLTGILVFLLVITFECSDKICDIPYSTSEFHFSVTERK